jgi:hypothetical protein
MCAGRLRENRICQLLRSVQGCNVCRVAKGKHDFQHLRSVQVCNVCRAVKGKTGSVSFFVVSRVAMCAGRFDRICQLLHGVQGLHSTMIAHGHGGIITFCPWAPVSTASMKQTQLRCSRLAPCWFLLIAGPLTGSASPSMWTRGSSSHSLLLQQREAGRASSISPRASIVCMARLGTLERFTMEGFHGT